MVELLEVLLLQRRMEDSVIPIPGARPRQIKITTDMVTAIPGVRVQRTLVFVHILIVQKDVAEHFPQSSFRTNNPNLLRLACSL